MVGYLKTPEFNQSRAFITDTDGVGIRDLGTLGNCSGAQGINDIEQVVLDWIHGIPKESHQWRSSLGSVAVAPAW